MKMSTPQFADAFSPFPPATAPDATAMLTGLVRSAVTQAQRLICGADPEEARNAYLAEATDRADLERRYEDWDRAQTAYRSLPPSF